MANMGTTFRNLDLAESTFWLLDRASSMNFAVFADGKGTLQIEAVKEALLWLQSKHPMLQVSIVHEPQEGSLSFTSQEKAVPIPFREISAKDARESFSDSVTQAIMQPFENGESPLMRCGLIRTANQFRLFLVFHHSIADGRSGLKLLDLLVQKLASSNGSEPPDTNPKAFPAAVHERLPANNTPPVMESNPASGVSFFEKKKSPPAASLLEIQLEPELMASLRAAGKSNGATLHGVLGACLLQSLANFEQRKSSTESGVGLSEDAAASADSETKRMALASPADLRTQMASDGSAADELALYISLITTTADVPSLESWKRACEASDFQPFWTLASFISKDVHNQIRTAALDFYRMLPEPGRYLTKPDPGKAYGALIQRLPQALAFSNAGIVGEFAAPADKSWSIENVAFTVHPSISQIIFVAATTYRDRLNLTLHIDANRWPESGLESYRQELVSLLDELRTHLQ
ncbi:MAG: hypothetical protein CMN77_07095 [Spirochaetaceae bacterium]|nr:hypothetical protein [Spirochaetaceae bacterium]|tara:strand:- start:2919 stop:4313 length:1395 start_codon:yes stop_codon:yes gene_type:complete